MTLFDLPDEPSHDEGEPAEDPSPAAGEPVEAQASEREAAPAPVDGPTERIRLVLSYDGAPFHGFALNPGVSTVAGRLAEAIERVTGRGPELTCAGRTDKGVHARAQVVTFDAPAGTVDLARLVRSLNKLAGPEVAVAAADVVPDDFDARFSATARRYRYTVLNRPTPDPFLAATAWHVDQPLLLPVMVLACDALIGEHDFAAFCRRPKRIDGEEASLVRRVTEATWTDVGDGTLRFEIEASSFCHQMVRSIVGTLVDVGRGRKHPGDLLGIMRAADRSRASDLAPPQGLSLWRVSYPGWSTDDALGAPWPTSR